MSKNIKTTKLEDVKKEIRALLISSQHGIPLYNLTGDYYDLVGVALDFTDLGFVDLESFLEAIPDVVHVDEGPDGQKILKHVSDERTKHIEDLVERQKPKGQPIRTRSKKARGPTGPSSSPTPSSSNNARLFQTQSKSHYSKPGSNSNRSSSSSPLLPTPPNPPNGQQSLGFRHIRKSSLSNNNDNNNGGHLSVVGPSSKKCLSPPSSRLRPSTEMMTSKSFRRPSIPNFVRIQIQQALATFKEPVSQSLFENAYKEKFGAYLNYEKCGFGSVDELLKSIPDFVKRSLQKNGQYSYKLTGSAASDFCGKTSPFSPKTNSSSPLLPSPFLQPYSSKNSGFKATAPNNVLNTSPHHSNSAENKKNKDPGSRSPIPSMPPNNLTTDVDADDIIDLWIDDFDSSINPKVIQKIEKVLQKHPDGLYASMLCVEYKKIHGQDLDYRDLGYLSVIELISKLKSVRIVRPTVSGDWLLFDSQKPYADVQKLVEKMQHLELNKTSLVKDREKEVRLKISKMLETLQDGVNLDQFMVTYKKITGDEFHPKDIGFKSLESYILSLAGNVVEISYTGNACLTIRSLRTAKLEKPAESSIKMYDLPKSKETFSNCTALPEDAVGPGVSYRILDIYTEKKYVEVFVSNVQTPSNFWIQFRGTQHSLALEKLMDDLETLYDSAESNKYQVPDDFLQVGLVAVTVYPVDQNWHRILITSVPNLSYVEVYFVDYGNTCVVSRNSLRLLRRDFLNLPMQAIQARLANIKPIGDNWTANANNRMLKLCFSKPLVSIVTKVKDRVMSLCLVDTSIRNVDIHINEVLIKEEYGYFAPDDERQTESPSPTGADSGFSSNSENAAGTCSVRNTPPPQYEQGVTKSKSEEEKDLPSKHATDNPKLPVSRPTSIQWPSPSASRVFNTINNLKQKQQNSKLTELTLNTSHNVQRPENITRPTSISTSCVNQMKIAEKSNLANNSCVFNTTSMNNHVPKIQYPISKGSQLKPFVKKVRLTDEHTVHIFNFNGTACISSGDLSAFLWKIDIIRTMLRTVNLGISKVIICEEDYSELFSELKRINFSGLWDGEERKDWITLFRLEDVPVVLETFNHPSAELKMAVQVAIENFDPNNEFWKGNGKERATDNTSLNVLPISKPTSPKPIPKSISHRQSPTMFSEQYGLSSSSSPPQFFFGKGSPSQRTEMKIGSSESSPRSRRPSTVTLEDIKTINANITQLHKLRHFILHKLEKGDCLYDSYINTLESVESKLQKLNALLIKASPTVESKDPPGQGRLLSPYQQNSCNSRSTPSPAGSLGFSPRDTRSTFQSPSPSPLSDTHKADEDNCMDDLGAKKFCTLYVGSLKSNTTDKMLRNYFGKFGNVVSCTVKRNRAESLGFAYVTYRCAEMVDTAQKKRPHYMGSTKMVTRRAIPLKLLEKHKLLQTKIFIGGIKPETTDKQIRDAFSRYGTIQKFQRILNRKTGCTRGFCFITYDDYDSVDQCVLRGKIYLDGVYVEIKIAVPKAE